MRDYDELVKTLRLRATLWEKTYDDEDNVLKQAADAIEDLIAALTASNEVIAKSRDKWISVEERPITEPGNYITMTNATGKDNGVIAQKFVKKTIRGKTVERWEWCGRISPWTVTHYMPMPEPPAKEET